MSEPVHFYEIVPLSLRCHGEELCGDEVKYCRLPDRTIVVLSDGLGCGIRAAILARLIPWIRRQPFGAPYWAFSFAVAALPLGAMRMIERGAAGSLVYLAPVLFGLANLIIGGFFVASLVRLAQGRYVPPPQPPAA